MGKKGNKKLLGSLAVMALSVSLLPGIGIKADEPDNGEEFIVKYVGDVDKDGGVNSKDVTTLRRYLAGGWGVELNEEESDIDGDGKLTSKDVTVLRRFLAGGWGINLNRTEYRKHPDGKSEEFIIDSNGRTLAYVQKDSDGKEMDSATWEYDEDGKVIKELNYDENRELEYTLIDYIYDDEGLQVGCKEKNENGVTYTWTFTYYPAEEPDMGARRATEKKIGDDGSEEYHELYKNGRWSYEKRLDPDGNISETEWYENGNEAHRSSTDINGWKEEEFFLEDGTKSSRYTVDLAGDREEWEYYIDGKDKTWTVKDSEGIIRSKHTYTYNESGQLIKEEVYSDGENEIVEWEYEGDHVIKETSTDENENINYIRSGYTYDKSNGLVLEYTEENSDGVKYTCSFTYYVNEDEGAYIGPKTEKKNGSDGSSWEADYYLDGTHKREAWTNADGNSVEKLFYENGNRISELQKGSDGSEEKWTFDEYGHELTHENINADGSVRDSHEFEYDKDGKKTKEIYKERNELRYTRTDYTFDELGREKTFVQTEADGFIFNCTNTYFAEPDENGWYPIAVERHEGTDGVFWEATFFRDGWCEKESWADNDGTRGQKLYREDGSRLSEYHKYPDGSEEEWTYNKDDRDLTHVSKDPDGSIRDSHEWEYDEDGNKTKEIYKERNKLRYTRTDYTFDELGREETFVQTDADDTVFNCRLTYFEEPNEDGWYPTATETYESAEGAYRMVEFFRNGRYKNEVWMDNDGNLGQKYFREDGSRTSEYHKYPDGSSEDWEYNEYDRETMYTRTDPDGNISEAHEWKYDEKGNKTLEIYYEYDELIYTRTDYTFDELGREKTFVQVDSDEVTYNFTLTYYDEPNEDGWYPCACEEGIGSDNSKLKREFYRNGYMSYETWTEPDGSLFEKEYREDGTRIREYHKYGDGESEEWICNKNGDETYWVRKDSEDAVLESKTFTYDENGKNIKEEIMDADGKLQDYYEWKYDNDNCIEERHYDNNDNLIESFDWEYEDGMLSKTISKDGAGNVRYTRTNYKFDKFGRETEYIEDNSDGNIYTCTLAYYPDVDWPCRCFESRANSDGEWSVEIYRNGQWSLEKWLSNDGSGYEKTFLEDGTMVREIITNTDGSRTVTTYDDNGNLLTTKDYAPGEEIED